MLSSFCDDLNDGMFINSKFNNAIEVVLPNTELNINFKCSGTCTKKICCLVAEKIECQGLIQIRIFEKHDRAKMFISTTDVKYFEQLRQDQSLHVTFSGFVDNITKMLKECHKGNLEISITQEKGNLYLQFYERRQFKNLIHLSLPLKEAPLPLVVFYVNRLFEDMVKEKLYLEKRISHMQFQIDQKSEEVIQTKNQNAKKYAELLEREKLMSARFQEELNKLHEQIKKMSEERISENSRFKENLLTLQSRIDQLQTKNTKLTEEKMKEVRKSESAREEISCIKSNLANMKETNEKLHSELASVKNMERKNEMHLNDAKHNNRELQEKLKKIEKIQSDLNAELEAERKICSTKRQALEIATEEIEKANDIISKQGKELVSIRKLLDLRTQVALSQENVLNEKDKEILLQKAQIEHLQSVIVQFSEESIDFPKKLESLRKLADQIEHKYTQRFTELSKKVCSEENNRKSLR